MSWLVDSNDPECLVFIDQKPRSGEANMELDARALEFACNSTQTGQSAVSDPTTDQLQPGGSTPSICRLYSWKAPTVTLGYFQDMSVRIPDAIQNCPRVKRLTGGGAILHDQELTYSIAIPACHSIRHQPLFLYDAIHNAIIATLSRHGISSSLRRDSVKFQSQSPKVVARSEEPFLCFLRQDDRDIVIDRHKVVGSAQRRRKGSILQHGSILLKASQLVPEVLGLNDLAPQLNLDVLPEQLASAIGEAVAPQTKVMAAENRDCPLESLLNHK